MPVDFPEPEEYLEAGELKSLDREMGHLARSLQKKEVSFLIGAGMSMPSKVPSYETLVKHIVRAAWYPDEQPDLANLAEDVKEEIQRIIARFPYEAIMEAAVTAQPALHRAVYELVKSQLEPGDALTAPKPHPGHTSLAAICQACRIPAIYTTNFDLLLEGEFDKNGAQITGRTYSKMDAEIEAGKTALVHLHGTLDDAPILYESQIYNPKHKQAVLFPTFISDFTRKIFVLVGYSLRDPDLRAIFHHVKGILDTRREELAKKTYIVEPYAQKGDVTVRGIASAIWKSRGVELLPIDAESFFCRLRERFNGLKYDDWKAEIAKRLRSDVHVLNQKIEQIEAVFTDFTTQDVLSYLDLISRRFT